MSNNGESQVVIGMHNTQRINGRRFHMMEYIWDYTRLQEGPQRPLLLMDEILHHLGALNYCNS